MKRFRPGKRLERCFGKQFNRFTAIGDALTGAQLGALAGLDCAINPDLAGFNFGMREAAGRTQTGRLEQLIKLDVVAVDRESNRHESFSDKG